MTLPTPAIDSPRVKLWHGDCLEVLAQLPERSVQTCITSPPYWGLRDYGIGSDAHGLEKTPEEWVENEVAIYRAVRRVLRDDGTLWINVGDSYWGTGGGNNNTGLTGRPMPEGASTDERGVPRHDRARWKQTGILKSLDLCQMPDRLALALQADGWYLRSKIIWAKGSSFEDRSGSVMPESISGWRYERCRVKVKAGSVKRMGDPSKSGDRTWVARDGDGRPQNDIRETEWNDCPGCEKCKANDGLVLRKGSWRPTSAYEVVLWMAKGPDYFCDGDAVREEQSELTVKMYGHREDGKQRRDAPMGVRAESGRNAFFKQALTQNVQPDGKRNLRNVWRINTEPNSMGICRICKTIWLKNAPKKHCENHPDSEEEGKNVTGHFAAFPEDLVTPMIRASTPERGSCAKCGAPWVRVIQDNTPRTWSDKRTDKLKSGTTGLTMGTTSQIATLGHRPSCSCGAETRPAIVLDIFAGSGTTLQVARRLGCKAIGIELNPEYISLAMKRLGQGVLPYGPAP